MNNHQQSDLNSDNIVDFIADIFQRRGAESYLGECVSMSEHMLQAACLAEKQNASDPVIAAALLHDIGHYTNEFADDALDQGINNFHDIAGAQILEPYFPGPVVDCIRYHVDAKRYLCAVESSYFGQLSEASVHTLNLQGGPMSTDETAEFARQPHLDNIIQVRRWDEQAKMVGAQTPNFSHYVPLLKSVQLR